MGLFDRFKKKEAEKTPDGNTASFAELKDEILPAAEAEETAEAAPEAENEEPAEAESAASAEAESAGPAETAAEEEAPAPAPAPVPQGPRMTPLTKEQIEKSEENGKILTYLIERHYDLKNKDSFLTAVKGLEGTKLWVPMHILMSKSDLEAMKAAVGKTPVKPKDPVRFVPDILKNKDGDRLFPAFTTRDEIPADYRKRFQWVQMDSAECGMQVIRNERLAALIINPFTKNLVLRRDMLEKMIVKKPAEGENAPAQLS
jgi:hypothetical protein